MGWSTDRNAVEPTYVGGESVKFISPTTLYAVWKEYTNPNYFTYENTKVTGFSELGIEKITQAIDIVIPRVNPTKQDITEIAKFSDSTANNFVNKVDLSLVTSLRVIAEDAFADFAILTEVSGINKETNIGYGAFATRSLTKIGLQEDSKYVLDSKGNLYYVEGTTAKLHTYLISISLRFTGTQLVSASIVFSCKPNKYEI